MTVDRAWTGSTRGFAIPGNFFAAIDRGVGVSDARTVIAGASGRRWGRR